MLRTVDLEKCVGCGACFKACAFDVYRMDTCQEKTSPCRPACPAGTDVRAYMAALQLGDHARAAMTLLERNALPLLTSRICQHYCEKTCTRKAVDAPVNIPALENYLGTWALDHELPLPPVSRAGMAVVIGSGAAGLAAAWFMRLRGFAVEVHEKESAAGGRLREQVAPELLARQLDFLAAHDITFRLGSAVGDGRDVDVRGLLNGRAKAVIAATGAGSAEEFGSVADSADGRIVVDPATQATRTNGFFAAGPVAGGSPLIAHEIGSAFEAAWSAGCFADGWDMLEGRPPRKLEVFAMPADKLFPYSEKLPIGNLPPMPRNECRDDATFSYETAMLEAHRCVTCGAKTTVAYKNDCMTCFFCEMACPVGAIKVDPIKEEIPRTIEFAKEGVGR